MKKAIPDIPPPLNLVSGKAGLNFDYINTTKPVMKNVIPALSLLFIFLIILSFLKWDVYDRIQLKKDHRYTVGTIFKMKGKLAGGPGIYYHFNYDKKYYEGVFESVNWRNIKIGDRVYIIFNPQNPDNNKVVMGYFAPDSLVNIPEKGWSEKPKN